MESSSDRKKSAVIPLICLLIYAAIIPMQLSNYVLCIGEDGHIELEFAVNGCCADTPSHDLDHPEINFTDTTAAHENHCGECVDLPIFASLNSEFYVVSVQKNMPTDDTFSVASPILSVTSISNNPSSSSPALIPPFINPTLISLRTVTLLI